MLKDNLAVLRKLNGYSQEEIAEKIGISRQAYAKWGQGSTIPDIEKCSLLAEVYGTTIDSLIKTQEAEAIVTYERIGHEHDLPVVGRVRKDFAVACHACVEDNLAAADGRTTEEPSAEASAVRKK